MKVAFLHGDKPQEARLASAFLSGAAKHGNEVAGLSMAEAPAPGAFDVVAMFGVKSREVFQAHMAAGSQVVMLDKGYLRDDRYFRFAVGSHHPTSRLAAEYPADRWSRLGIELMPWRSRGEHVLIAGSSAKYHRFYGLMEPTAFTKLLVARLRHRTPRPIVYRPKPSWKAAVPIEHTRFSRRPETIRDVLRGAWAVVTHGSNACFEALVAGVPSIVLGDAVTGPISSTSLDDIERPRLASDKERLNLVRGLAYHQFTCGEFANGDAWDVIRREIYGS